MTPLRARLTFFAVVSICIAAATNALFLQSRSHLSGSSSGPTTSMSVTDFTKEKAGIPVVPVAAPHSVPDIPGKVSRPLDKEQKLEAAIRRELVRKGYGALKAGADLREMIVIYEFDSGLPLTGTPTDFLFKRLIFDLNAAPRGAFADRAEADNRLVMEIQKLLLELGFFSGVLSGRMDIWTENAIKAFERHKSFEITGRLSEATLVALIVYSGQPLRQVGG